MSVILGKRLIFEFSKIAMLFRGISVGPPRVHLGEVRGANIPLRLLNIPLLLPGIINTTCSCYWFMLLHTVIQSRILYLARKLSYFYVGTIQ